MDEITLTTLNMALWRPIVDDIIRRYNIAESRTEAGASAVVLLEAMRTMGVFDAPPMREPVRQRGSPTAFSHETPIPTQTTYGAMVEETLGLPKREPGKDMKAPGYELRRDNPIGPPCDVT